MKTVVNFVKEHWLISLFVLLIVIGLIIYFATKNPPPPTQPPSGANGGTNGGTTSGTEADQSYNVEYYVERLHQALNPSWYNVWGIATDTDEVEKIVKETTLDSFKNLISPAYEAKYNISAEAAIIDGGLDYYGDLKAKHKI